MPQTPNYKLYVSDDVPSNYLEWFSQMAGETDSNMTKVDAVLGQKAAKSVAVDATLLASAWSGAEAPYTQEVTVAGLGASQHGFLSLSHHATKNQRDAARNAQMSVIRQEEEKLAFAADGEKPETDIPVSVILLGTAPVEYITIQKVPSQNGSLVYNGNTQFPTWDGYNTEQLIISGTTSATDAGTYSVSFTPCYDCRWQDGSTETKTATWSIEKTHGSISINPTELVLDPENRHKSITVERDGDGKITAVSSDTNVVTVSVSGNVVAVDIVNEKDASTEITICVEEGTNHTASNNITCPVTVKIPLKIYGVSWDGTSSTKWTRTDDASSFTDPIPYVAGASNYSSPFDNIYPWSGMVKSERDGGTMVAIPKFWYKLTQNGAGISIQLSNKATDGFSVSPAHMDRGDGKGERDVVYIGRYHCGSSEYKSTTNQSPKTSVTRSAARAAIHNLGNNIWQQDFAMRFTIWLLYLVEFANWDSQNCIGYGCGDGSSKTGQVTGSTDTMPYHTGTVLSSRTSYGVGTQYRYIEGLWDNVYDWCDGMYYNSGGMNIILNPNNFNDSSGGIYVGKPTNGYPSKFTITTRGGYPIFIPSASSGNVSTYSCDIWGFSYSSSSCIYVGGDYYQNRKSGLFFSNYCAATIMYTDVGARIQELP